jgi:hypothetical protein
VADLLVFTFEPMRRREPMSLTERPDT